MSGSLRHAYEYRHEHPGKHIWCDKGGCFIEDCPICMREAWELWEIQEMLDFAAHFPSKEVAPADWELDEMAEPSNTGSGTGGRDGG